jgi:hypothetical protein
MPEGFRMIEGEESRWGKYSSPFLDAAEEDPDG